MGWWCGLHQPPWSFGVDSRCTQTREPGKSGASCAKVPGSSTGPTAKRSAIGPAVINNNNLQPMVWHAGHSATKSDHVPRGPNPRPCQMPTLYCLLKVSCEPVMVPVPPPCDMGVAGVNNLLASQTPVPSRYSRYIEQGRGLECHGFCNFHHNDHRTRRGRHGDRHGVHNLFSRQGTSLKKFVAKKFVVLMYVAISRRRTS